MPFGLLILSFRWLLSHNLLELSCSRYICNHVVSIHTVLQLHVVKIHLLYINWSEYVPLLLLTLQMQCAKGQYEQKSLTAQTAQQLEITLYKAARMGNFLYTILALKANPCFFFFFLPWYKKLLVCILYLSTLCSSLMAHTVISVPSMNTI